MTAAPRAASRAAAALLGLGLAARLLYAWHGHRAGFVAVSTDGYETIALSLLDRGEYALEPGRPTAHREPLYPLFIAAGYAVSGRSPETVVFLQCLLGLFTCWCAWRLAGRLFGETAGLAALAACAFHPQLIYYGAYFYRDGLLTALFAALALCSSLWGEGGGGGRRAALLGGLAAAGLCVGNSAHIPAAALAGAAVPFSAPRGERLRRSLLFFAPVALAFGAWSARNLAAMGGFVAGSTHGGEEFYQALVVPPEDLGTARQVEIMTADPLFQSLAGRPEAEKNSALLRASLNWIAEHPGLYARRAAAGVAKFWRPWPYRRTYHHSYAALLAASLLSDAWLVPLGLAGLWRLRRRWRQAPALWAGALGLTAVFGAVHAVIRYRLPLTPALAVLAAGLVFGGRRGEDGARRAGGY